MATTKSSMDEDTSLSLSALRLIAPPLRLLSASMWKIMQQRDAMHYRKLVETVTSICETVPGLLHYRHQAKLSVGFRALVILEVLRQSDPPDADLVLQELDELKASSTDNRKRKDMKVEEAIRTFRVLVQSLLKSPAVRQQFFKEDFHQQYGESYIACLEKLLWEFLIRLDQLLPVPDLAQTVAWLSAAPAVQEECARTASQPQLLRTLLQHEKCLGHLGSATLLSSTGDSILSSLSLPLSGRVQQTIQSESTPKRVISPVFSATRATRRSTKDAMSQIAPVIGSISNPNFQKNTNQKVMSNVAKPVDQTLEMPVDMKTKLRSCSKKNTLEKNTQKEYVVGNMLVTVISQSSASEEEEEEDSNEKTGDGEASGKRDNMQNRENIVKFPNKKDKGDVGENSSKRNSKGICSQEEANLRALLVSCMKRRLRVVIPRLNIDNLHVHLNRQEAKNLQTKDISSDGIIHAVTRKRKLNDSTPTPKKYLANTLSLECSPCIPPILRFPKATPETPSSIADSTDDIIVDSEDERSEKVKRKVFTQCYYKSQHGTYVPTLQEFWNPGSYHRDIVSPGNRC